MSHLTLDYERQSHDDARSPSTLHLGSLSLALSLSSITVTAILSCGVLRVFLNLPSSFLRNGSWLMELADLAALGFGVAGLFQLRARLTGGLGTAIAVLVLILTPAFALHW